jgi:hypothetical protein
MREFLIVLVVLWAVAMAAIAATALAIHRRLRRVNDAAGALRRARPPMHWLVSPTACARLHRRLRDAVAAVRFAIPAPEPRKRRRPVELTTAQRLAAELELVACQLDADVVMAARIRGARGAALRRELRSRVGRVEAAAHRLALRPPAPTAVGAPGPDGDDALTRLADELDALAAAHAELDALDATLAERVLTEPAAAPKVSRPTRTWLPPAPRPSLPRR